ncbi:MAG: serine/threonine-protein kinase, partial [Burkholderiales bacterium]
MLLEYRLESVLGAGGFGMTYLGRDTHLEKQVAIKEYLPTDLVVRALDGSIMPITGELQAEYQWGLERFLQEARTLAKFSHPHIVRVNRYFQANGTGYMVMDYEQGESLYQMLKRGVQPDEAGLKSILMPLLDGLRAVHAAGFLHLDIKPSNIFVRESGSPVLIDFGAARHAVGGATRSLTSVLTPGYAPLEQYSSDGHQGPWSDLYALAGVAYRVLVKENPPDAVSRMKGDTLSGKLAA